MRHLLFFVLLSSVGCAAEAIPAGDEDPVATGGKADELGHATVRMPFRAPYEHADDRSGHFTAECTHVGGCDTVFMLSLVDWPREAVPEPKKQVQLLVTIEVPDERTFPVVEYELLLPFGGSQFVALSHEAIPREWFIDEYYVEVSVLDGEALATMDIDRFALSFGMIRREPQGTYDCNGVFEDHASLRACLDRTCAFGATYEEMLASRELIVSVEEVLTNGSTLDPLTERQILRGMGVESRGDAFAQSATGQITNVLVENDPDTPTGAWKVYTYTNARGRTAGFAFEIDTVDLAARVSDGRFWECRTPVRASEAD